MALYSVGLTIIYIYGLFNVPSLLSLDNNITHTQLGQHLKTALQVLDVSFYLSVAIASVFMGVYIFVIYSNYQRDLERMQRGDYSFLSIKTRKTSSDSIVAASLRYAGFQIASLVWCYILLTLFLWFLFFTVAYTVVLPLKGDVPFTFFEPVIILLSLILIRQIIFRGQTILVRNFFIQEFSVGNLEDKPTSRSLGLDNRRVFNVLAYFAFFYHTILGLFAALNRSLIGLGIGLVAMARTDKCMLPVGFEQFDRGYSTYVGMIILEIHHRNPVVAVFCDIILSTKSQTNALLRPVTSPNTNHNKRLRETANERHRRIQRRWQKAYTMINNPSVRREKRNIYKNCSPDDVKIEV